MSNFLTRFISVFVLSSVTVLSFAKPPTPGTYMVERNGRLDASMKLVLGSKNTFRFVGSNYSSAGRYTIDGDTLHLEWTHVDGQRVEGRMEKNVYLEEDGTFTIDRFTYVKVRRRS